MATRTSSTSRADLLRLIAHLPEQGQVEVAATVGFEKRTSNIKQAMPAVELPAQPFSAPQPPPQEHTDIALQSEARFLRVVKHQRKDEADDSDGPDWWRNAVAVNQIVETSDAAVTAADSNLRWPRMEVFLRRQLLQTVRTRRIDERRLVRQLANVNALGRLPRKTRQRWPDPLVLIHDRDDSLYPLWHDHKKLHKRLKKLLGDRLILADLTADSLSTVARFRTTLQQDKCTQEVLARGRCLLQTDFGAAAGGQRTGAWQHCLQWLSHVTQQSPLVTLSGFPASQLPTFVKSNVRLTYWDRRHALLPASKGHGQLMSSNHRVAVEQLVAMLSMTAQARPRLIRKLRQLSPITNHIWCELYVWNHTDMMHRLPNCMVDSEVTAQWQTRFESLQPNALKQKALACIEEDHSNARQYVKDHDALMRHARESSREFGGPYIAALIRDVVNSRDSSDPERARQLAWAARLVKSTDLRWLEGNEQLEALAYVIDVESHDNTRRGTRRFNYLYEHRPVQTTRVWQTGEQVTIKDSQSDSSVQSGSPIIDLQSRDGMIEWLYPDEADEFWLEGPPSWAGDWGEDEYGIWVDCTLSKGVVQRLRWVNAGQHSVGSPDTEPDRSYDEHLHDVRLTQGFWLADTACTQSAWQAITGNNPSRFSHDRMLPVEKVSWLDVAAFLPTLNETLQDEYFALPTEAQWEIACRASTRSPYSFGASITKEQANYDGEHTVPVKSLPCNPWGLYEMHGNVWEWCADWYGDYSEKRLHIDPHGPEQGDGRVLRGGGWDDSAAGARSAQRFRSRPVNADFNIGFRLARGQSGARPAAGRSTGRQAERRPVTERQPLRLVKPLEQSVTQHYLQASSAPVIIRSDRDEVQLELLEKPEWAKTIGRDTYGLFVDIDINGVLQRMRWINPGRFMMGSPESELERQGNETLHEVQLTEGYWLADTACTQALWTEVMEHNPAHFKGEDRPVESVSWDDTVSFLQRVNADQPGLRLTLPTEAQWEYACRAGTATPFSTGDQLTTEQANYDGNRPYGSDDVGQFREQTVDVDALASNPWGLYQMHGNVFEWCRDWYGSYSAEPVTVNPVGPDTGDERVLRGGCWNFSAAYARSAQRDGSQPDIAVFSIGFRLARGQTDQTASQVAGVDDQAAQQDGAEPRPAGLRDRSRS